MTAHSDVNYLAIDSMIHKLVLFALTSIRLCSHYCATTLSLNLHVDTVNECNAMSVHTAILVETDHEPLLEYICMKYNYVVGDQHCFLVLCTL